MNASTRMVNWAFGRGNRKHKKRMNKPYLFLTYLFVGMNLMTIVLMLLCAYSPHVSPARFSWASCLGLAFPVFVIANIAFVVFWLIFQTRFVWLPLVGFLLCAVPLYTFYPVNLSKETPEESLKVLSYNVCSFSHDTTSIEDSRVLAYLKDADADVVCMQEAAPRCNIIYFQEQAKKIYPHQWVSYVGKHRTVQVFLSKYPILSVEAVPYESMSNGSTAYLLKVDDDTVMVINNHMESIKLTDDDKADYRGVFKDIKKDVKKKDVKKDVVNLRKIFGKVRRTAAVRATQIDALAAYVRDHEQYSMIVCGDFNEPPLSYAVNRLSGLLTDSYVESGNGLGWSYKHYAIWVRIDHIFHSDDWESYGTYVDQKVSLSDHSPIITHLKRVKKAQ